jgi:hypothetical protein
MAARGSRRSAWLAGLTVGALGGVLALELPVLGYAILVVFAGLAVVVGPRLAALGGLLGGAGGVVLLLLGRAAAACAEFNDGARQQCIAPDVTPLVVAGGASLAVGILLSIAAASRSRPPRP